MINKLSFGFSLLAAVYFYHSHSEKNFIPTSSYLSLTEIQQQTALQKSIARGKEIYSEFCIQCHMANGKGNASTFPPLDGSDWLKKKRTESIHAIKYGQKGEIVVNGKKYNAMMPPMGLSDEEVADVMNYVSNSWTNSNKKMVTVKEVSLVKP